MRGIGKWVASALLLSAISCSEVRPLTTSIEGHVFVTGPVEGAVVTVYRYDAVTGLRGDRVAQSQPTDHAGYFSVPIGNASGPMMLVAVGVGASYREPATEMEVRWDSTSELRAVLSSTEPSGAQRFELKRGETVKVLVGPWSDLAVAYAEARLSTMADPSFGDAIARSYTLFAEHLETDIGRAVPIELTSGMTHTFDAGTHAGALLAGLSELVRRTETSGLTTMGLLQALREDIHDATFNGKDGDRQLAFGTCKDLCVLSAQTLRAELANAIGFFLDSDRNPSTLRSPEMTEVLSRIAKRKNELFPEDEPTQDFDTTPPTIQVVESSMLNEASLRPRIEGDPSEPPRVVYGGFLSGSIVRLSDASPPPKFTKYAPLYLPGLDNLPTWKFSVHDERSAETNIRLEARLFRGDAILTGWFIVAPVAGAGFNRQVAVSSAVHPKVGALDGLYKLEVRAIDESRNVSASKVVSWQQTVLPGPIRQIEAECDPCVDLACPHRYAIGPASCGPGFDAHFLIDQDGIPGRLNVIKQFYVQNPNPVPVRVKLRTDWSVHADFGKAWFSREVPLPSKYGPSDQKWWCDRPYEYPTDARTCWIPPPLSVEEPFVVEGRGTLPAYHRVFLDSSAGPEIVPCADCEPDERILPPHSTGWVRVYANEWGFLWNGPAHPIPFEGGALIGETRETIVGCLLNGQLTTDVTQCADTNYDPPVQGRRVAYQYVYALTRAHVDWTVDAYFRSRANDREATSIPMLGPSDADPVRYHKTWDSQRSSY